MYRSFTFNYYFCCYLYCVGIQSYILISFGAFFRSRLRGRNENVFRFSFLLLVGVQELV